MKKVSAVTLHKVRKNFYRNCIKEGLTPIDAYFVGRHIVDIDSQIDVMAGIKASKQRKINTAKRKRELSARAKKAWTTRRANA